MKEGSIDHAYASVISEFLTEQRKKSGRTLAEVGKIFGVGANTIYRYEAGQREIPLDLFRRLCVLYGVDFEESFREISQKATDRIIREGKK